MSWQRDAIQAAVDYLTTLSGCGVDESEEFERVRRDLSEVLEPKLRRARLRAERELDIMDAHGVGGSQTPGALD